MRGLIIVSYYDREVGFVTAIPCNTKEEASQAFADWVSAQKVTEDDDMGDVTEAKNSNDDWHYYYGNGPYYMGRFIG